MSASIILNHVHHLLPPTKPEPIILSTNGHWSSNPQPTSHVMTACEEVCYAGRTDLRLKALHLYSMAAELMEMGVERARKPEDDDVERLVL